MSKYGSVTMKEDIILHLCRDGLFNDIIVDLFEEVNPERNEYILIKEKGSELEFKSHPRVKEVSEKEYREYVEDYSFVLVHSLTKSNIWACSLLTKHRVALSSWGGDLIGNHSFYADEHSLMPLTLAAKRRHEVRYGKKEKRIYQLLKKLSWLNKWYYYIRTGKHLRPYLVSQSYANVDVISTVLPSEKKIVEQIEKLDAKYVWFSYGHLKLLLKGVYGKSLQLGNRVMIGHSAYYSSNHLDAIQKVRELGYRGEVYIPLAYGLKWCKEEIYQYAKETFGEQVAFLDNPVALESYLKDLLKCSALILNTRKQEACGTLVTSLYLGMRIFLNKEGMLYAFAKEQGFCVFSLEDMTKENVNTPLQPQQVAHNRCKLEQVYGKDVVLKRCKNFINALYGS